MTTSNGTHRPILKASPTSATVSRGASKRQTLADWVDEAISDRDKVDPSTLEPLKLSRIALVHMRGANGQLELHTVTMGAGTALTPKLIANMLEGKAQSYCQDLPGLQTFNLLAFYGSNTEAQAYHPFSIAGEAFHPGLSTESPTAEGIVQMLMRHVEIKEKLHVQERVTIFDALLQTVDFLSKSNKALAEDNAEAFTIMKEIMLEKTLNTHDLRMKELEFGRDTQERDKLFRIVPGMVNAATGREIFPQSTVDTAIIESLAEHVNPDQLQMAIKALGLPDEASAILIDRFEQIATKKVEDQKRAKALAESARGTSTDPEAEAAGEIVKT